MSKNNEKTKHKTKTKKKKPRQLKTYIQYKNSNFKNFCFPSHE